MALAAAALGLAVPAAAAPGGPKACTNPTPPTSLVGLATYMNPGRMEQAARRMNRSLDGVIGGVALNHRNYLGLNIWIEHNGQVTGPYRVVDTAQAGEHCEKREARGYVLEVTYELADEWGMIGIGPTPVTVWFLDPRPQPACPPCPEAF